MHTTPIWLADAPPKVRGAQRSVRAVRSWWEAGAGVLVAAFLAAELVVITTVANGPTLDEGIYITAGRRTLDGHGTADGYLSWFAGSLLWPALAGLGDTVAGLPGARALAARFITIAIAAMWRGALVLFGPRAAFFSVAVAITTGPVIALGHLAVIDAPAIAGIAVAFWAITELAKRDNRGWLVLAVGAFSFGVLAKYPAAACGIPLVLLLVVLRGRRAAMDLLLCALMISAVLMTYFLSAREPLSYFLHWRVRNNPGFGVTRSMVAFSQVWYGGLILLLAIGGWLLCRRKALATVLLTGGLIFPAYHVLTGNSVGDSKQIVFGFVFTLPLAGRLLEGLARWPNGAVLATMVVIPIGVFGALQAERIDRAWIDVEPAADYLAAHARPGQRFLIDNAWPFTRRLYEEGKLSSPWNVYDVYRVRHGQAGSALCKADWFVSAQGAGRWPTALRHRVAACGTFRRVYSAQAPVTSIGRSLGFVTWNGKVEIYRNVHRGRVG